MMNKYYKYLPNVFLAQCEEEHQKGDIILVTNKYGKESECEVHNLIGATNAGFFYSITRCDGMNKQTYAQKKAERYNDWAMSAEHKSDAAYEASNEGREFLRLAEPIKIGHHSEHRHRALIERNHKRMGKSIELGKKAEAHAHKAAYWESMTNKIDLSMPESIEYFAHKLDKAKAIQAGMKDGTIPRIHSYSLTYQTKEVKSIEKNLAAAIKLWG
ncbi:Protein of unknown function DUF3560 [uncultured Caudovirales phage]|uniref:DUF3560 domain-containing protein n=1 Tax=uncultured Caudovirales phage TaxID=2100421 RepID=A0A6J5PG62_9CAUD|nr:Protein of unknown function DUF3560 [uncultured Caudovirales phage]